MSRARMRFGWLVAAGVVAILLMLACGVAVAAAQTQPALVSSVQNVDTPGSTWEDALAGTVGVAAQNVSGTWYAYTPAYYNDDLTALDMGNPADPVIVGESAPPSSGTQLDGADTVNISNGFAYVVSKNENACSGSPCSSPNESNDNGTGNSLSIFNVGGGNATAPLWEGSVTDPGTLFGAYGVTVTKINGTSYALVAAQGCIQGQQITSGQSCSSTTTTQGDDLDVINVGDPTNPTISGTVSDTPGPSGQFVDDLEHPTAVAVSGNYAYVTSFYGNALTVVNISNPSSPTVVAELQNSTDLPAPVDVAVEGNYAYVANQNGGKGTFTVVDISNPTSPTVVGMTTAVGLAGGYQIRVSGDLAYVASRNEDAITAVDITNPTAPNVLTSLVDTADLNATTGLDLMNYSGNEYMVASSPYLSSEANYIYPPFPSFDNTTQVNTGTISAIQLDPIANTVTIATSSEPTAGTSATSADFSFSTADAVASVACSLDGAAFGPCTTETTAQYSGLPVGQHTFTVQTTDAAGNIANASYTWTIGTQPSNTALPTVTGNTVVAGMLTASTGSWNGNPTSYAYQWQSCDAQGASCADLSDTGTTYTIGSNDVGDTLRVAVTATNNTGSSTATSPTTAVVAGPPTAGFNESAITTVPATGSPVQFASDSTAYGNQGITSSVWNFGDGTTRTGTSVVHTFSAAGTYTVTLTVTQTDGQTAQTSEAVTVDNPPSADFIWSPSSSATDAPFAFQSTSSAGAGAINLYSWSFGDGGTSAVANPAHTYIAAGTYTVTLTVMQSDGLTATMQHSITVTEPPASSGGSGITTAGSTGPSSGSTTTNTTADTKAWLAHALASTRFPTIGALLKKNGTSGTLSASSATGRITITLYASIRHHRIVIARGAAALKAGHPAQITIKLTTAGRALLTKSKAVRTTVLANLSSQGAHLATTRTLTVKR